MVNKSVMGGVIGSIIVAIIIIGFVAYNDSVHDDARLADLRATYFDDTDRLVVAVVLTNSDGQFTEANGHLKLTIKKGTSTVYSNEYDFTKNEFLTWNNLFGGQTRGVPFTINERFSSGEYDVYANMQTKSGSWEGLHATFYGAYEETPSQPESPSQPSIPVQPSPTEENNCDPSYPDFCIPRDSPDLDCKDVLPHKKFKVLQPDPHGFDQNKDGIGCEK